MERTVHVVMIHGIGKHTDEIWPERIAPLEKKLSQRGVKASISGISYATIAQGYADDYWYDIDVDLDYKWAREPLLHIFADAMVYGNRPLLAKSNYRQVHQIVHTRLSAVINQMAEDDRLVIRAHSFGCHVISNFIYDNQESKGAHDTDLDGEPQSLPKIKELDDRLALLVTSGCNIPLFAAGGPHPVPFSRPNENFRWLNIFDKDDILGWPIEPLGPGYQTDWISDRQVNSGGPFRSHNNSWFDDDVNNRIVTAIRRIP